MARIKHYNRKTNKWEYADSSFTVGGNIDYYEQPEAPDDAPVGSLWYDTDEMPPEESGGISITGATVGQTVKIAEVDENGVPTAWEAVDFPSEGKYELIERFTTTEDLTLIHRDLPKCRALTITYLVNSIESNTYFFNRVGFEDNSRIDATFYMSTLNIKIGARLEIFPRHGYYTGIGYVPSGAYSNTNNAFVLPNHATNVKRDSVYINSLEIDASYNNKIIPAGTVIEIWGVRV